MSTVSKRAPRRGREMSAQGIALGSGLQPYTRPVRAKEWSSDINLLPLQGEIHICPHTQGFALGYELFGLSGHCYVVVS